MAFNYKQNKLDKSTKYPTGNNMNRCHWSRSNSLSGYVQGHWVKLPTNIQFGQSKT